MSTITYEEALSVQIGDYVIVKNKDLMLKVRKIHVTPTTVLFYGPQDSITHHDVTMILH